MVKIPSRSTRCCNAVHVLKTARAQTPDHLHCL